MNFAPAIGGILALALGFAPIGAFAQALTSSGSPLPDQPYTLFYPDVMATSAEVGGPLTINHPTLPLQCVLTAVPVDDTTWTAEAALSTLDKAAVAAGWNETLPGFSLTTSAVENYQGNAVLQYEGSSSDATEGGPITLVHIETVAQNNGYTLDCFYATAMAAEARPVVDLIIANFSTQQDAQAAVTP